MERLNLTKKQHTNWNTKTHDTKATDRFGCLLYGTRNGQSLSLQPWVQHRIKNSALCRKQWHMTKWYLQCRDESSWGLGPSALASLRLGSLYTWRIGTFACCRSLSNEKKHKSMLWTILQNTYTLLTNGAAWRSYISGQFNLTAIAPHACQFHVTRRPHN